MHRPQCLLQTHTTDVNRRRRLLCDITAKYSVTPSLGGGTGLVTHSSSLCSHTSHQPWFTLPPLNPLTSLSQKTSLLKEHNLRTLCRFSGLSFFLPQSPSLLPPVCSYISTFWQFRFPDKSTARKLKIFPTFLVSIVMLNPKPRTAA